MDDAVEHGIGQGGIGDDVVPAVHWHLRGNEDGAAAMTVLDDFEQVTGIAGRERFRSPVVDDEKMRLGNLSSQSWIASIASRQGKLLEQS